MGKRPRDLNGEEFRELAKDRRKVFWGSSGIGATWKHESEWPLRTVGSRTALECRHRYAGIRHHPVRDHPMDRNGASLRPFSTGRAVHGRK